MGPQTKIQCQNVPNRHTVHPPQQEREPSNVGAGQGRTHGQANLKEQTGANQNGGPAVNVSGNENEAAGYEDEEENKLSPCGEQNGPYQATN